ncbi:putative Endonuclease V [Trypanosoma vivax]|uniref:Putative endonuclease V n=1 Tax=Trypanosoma vivax (strain Y486) TaxID=1055687 RepID=G0U6X8_TRYVY|nr:putative endonuclease V [Trypanosoma vivax]KAH8611707.1 putative Endonuclease V [Trypanosoma vivax]CCC51635.1 putative endonuclease V [Trypanosoma vivax Y486]
MREESCGVNVQQDGELLSTGTKDGWVETQKKIASRVRVPHSPSETREHFIASKETTHFSTFAFPWHALKNLALATLGPRLSRAIEQRVQTASCLPELRHIGGCDVSFIPGSRTAVACLVVLRYPSLERCSTLLHCCEVTEPYIPGYLAFREAEPLMELFRRARVELEQEGCYPQLLLVDGCGVHHPLRCGLASHLGVLLDIPTIGCAKNFMAVDGLSRKVVHELFEEGLRTSLTSGDVHRGDSAGPFAIPIVGESGQLWCYAATPNCHVRKAIYISPGHRVGFEEAAVLTLSVCRYRVPEPIRMADIISRTHVRKIMARGSTSRA